jgi:7,8-dihydroneopterin aldolase/epimerase/oxygenase
MNQSSFGSNKLADAMRGTRHVFVRDLKLEATLGIYAHEKIQAQRILVNIDLTVDDLGADLGDELSNVVCYETAVRGVQNIVADGHVHLVETLAEAIADQCLQDRRVQAVRVRIEKPDAIAQAASVGVEIERLRPAQT